MQYQRRLRLHDRDALANPPNTLAISVEITQPNPSLYSTYRWIGASVPGPRNLPSSGGL